MIIEPHDPASIVASGLRPSAGIIGAEIDAAVITPTVADPALSSCEDVPSMGPGIVVPPPGGFEPR